MGNTLQVGWILGLAVLLGGCALPEYSVDESLGSGGSGGALPDLPDPPTSCDPPSNDGPTMVPVRGGYCIDSTEVTWRQYMGWAVKAMVDPGFLTSQSDECSWNTELIPPASTTGCEEPLDTDGDLKPVVCVDWCDAYAYCKAKGKRLCGKIGGGELPLPDAGDPSASQWMNACTSGGRHVYPYGETFDPNTCQALGVSQASPVPVQTKTGCQSTEPGYTGVFDLSGNVAEWEDSCSNKIGAGDVCKVRGGSFKSSEDSAACLDNLSTPISRGSTVDYVGFRCCWDPPG